MTIMGIEITDEIKAAMLAAMVDVETHIGRRLSTGEIDRLIVALAYQCACAERRRAPTLN